MQTFLEEYFLGECFVRTRFHLYCPGCGGTRAVKALLQLHILQSVQYNPIPLILLLDIAITWITWWIEKKTDDRFRYFKLRQYSKLNVLFVIACVGVVRNVLLIWWGIDMLGDFK